MEKDKKILREETFKCKNCELRATQFVSLTGYDKGREIWDIYKGEEYIDSMDNGIGKFYSLSWGDVPTFNDYIEIWRSRYVLDGFRTVSLHKDKNAYMVDLYQGKEVSKDEFDSLIKDIKFLLDKKCVVHYNDEHGVGYFKLKGKKYQATHCRRGTSHNENLTIDGIKEFLRGFFEIGYELQPIW